VERADGEIWFSLLDEATALWGICKVVGARTQCYYGKTNGYPLAEDGMGSLWTGNEATITRWKPGSSSTYVPHGLRLDRATGVGSLAPARDGSMWVGMQSGGRGAGLQQFTNGTWKPFIGPHFDSSTLSVTALLLDRENALWIGTVTQGIYRIRGRQIDHFGSSDGLSSDLVMTMGLYEDREGNVWVNTSEGLDRFRDQSVTTYSVREGLPSGEVDSVLAARDGTVWIGGQALTALRQERTPNFAVQGVPGNQVTPLLEDHAGRLWVGVNDSLTIYMDGKFHRIDRPDGKPIGLVDAMTEDAEHNIWAETTGPPRTLFRIQDFKVQERFPAPQMPAVRRVIADPEGGIWLGLISGDLARYRDGKLERFPFEHGSSPGSNSRINQLLVTPEGAVLGATNSGLIAWRNGRQQYLTVQNGLPCNGINSEVLDNQGDLWLSLECGLVEIPNTQLKKWWGKPDTIVQFDLLDSLDGFRPGEVPFEGAARSPDGRLWFANGVVLQMIDPAHLSRNLLAPPVQIEEVIADRKSYPVESNLRLPPITRDLEIDYTALSFMAPQKVRFRYKLEGHDVNWQEPGTRRQALYSDLAPGKYCFHVIACNNDGLWNEAGATLDFRVLPAWYQTNLFRVGCLVIVLFTVGAIHRFRMLQISKALSASFDERLAERTQLARDLHDTLLQTIQGSRLVANDALHKHSDEAKMRRALEQLSLWLEQATQEGRMALNSLRTSTSHNNDLAEALQRAAENGPTPGSMAAKFSLVGNPREMHPIVRDEIYRIGYEAIRNAQAHSKGSHLEVELRYDLDLILRVCDNGIGIDPVFSEHGKEGHFGLRGIRERAERIGGKLTIVTSAKSGTEITLTVPDALAFLDVKTAPVSAIRAVFRRNTPRSMSQ
jgi:signal transduction histidine kinase